MQAPKEIIQNKYLRIFTTSYNSSLDLLHSSSAVGVGHENGNNLYTFFNYSSLFAFVRKFCLTMSMLIFFGISFLYTCMVFKIILSFFADRSLACRLPTKNLFYESLKRPRRHFWAFGLSLKEHCFHQFESNLKTRHYEYAFDFEGYWYFIYSCVSMF